MEQTETTKLSLLRFLKRIPRWLVIGGALLIAACGSLYLFASLPYYLVLDVPSPSRYGWDYEEKTVQHWPDSGSKYFIWRRETIIFTCGSAFDSSASVMAYFDGWLASHGWEQADTIGGSLCNLLPEANFLDRDVGYVDYRRSGTPNYYTDVETVCVAVWSVDEYPEESRCEEDAKEDAVVTSYNVMLTTVKPSFRTSLLAGLE